MTLPDDSSTATTGEEPLPEAALESIAGGSTTAPFWRCLNHQYWPGAYTKSCKGTEFNGQHNYYESTGSGGGGGLNP